MSVQKVIAIPSNVYNQLHKVLGVKTALLDHDLEGIPYGETHFNKHAVTKSVLRISEIKNSMPQGVKNKGEQVLDLLYQKAVDLLSYLEANLENTSGTPVVFVNQKTVDSQYEDGK